MHSSILSLFSAISTGVVAVQFNGGFSIPVERSAPSARMLAGRGMQGTSEIEAITQGTDWVTSVNVGGQILRAQIDTGSSDLWFISTLADDATKNKFKANTFYDPSKSQTWQLQTGYTFNVSYDTGEAGAVGVVGTETVELGGVTATSMALGAATGVYGDGTLDTTYDGVMGLGWGQTQSSILDASGNNTHAPSFMQAIQSQLNMPVFTCDFKFNRPNTISFGFVNQSLYTGNLAKLAIDNTTTYWTSNNVTFSAGTGSNSKSIGLSSGLPVIFDSGGIKTTLDNQTAADYWAQVSGADNSTGSYLFPCNTQTLPDLTFHFTSGDTATITGSVLNQTAFSRDGITCSGGVQPSGNGAYNAGNGFFGTYFTVFNQAEPSMSFAPYSQVDDTAGTNEANLPTATDAQGLPSATSTSSTSSASPTHNAAVKTAGKSAFALLVAGAIGCML